MEKIIINTFSKYYEKEKNGIKNNIVVFISEKEVEKCRILASYFGGLIDNLEVEIVNTETKESFIRQVRDVSYFEGIYIITWNNKDE